MTAMTLAIFQIVKMEDGVAPEIVLDEEVYEFLKKRAEPFVDTPNTVLRRILGLDPSDELAVDAPHSSDGGDPGTKCSKSRASGSSSQPEVTAMRAPKGSLLPQTNYWRPILEALVVAGGTAPATQVIDTVGRELDDRFTELDRQNLRSGGIRWRNRAQFARLRMVERGLMVKGSPPGTWAITKLGRRYLGEEPA